MWNVTLPIYNAAVELQLQLESYPNLMQKFVHYGKQEEIYKDFLNRPKWTPFTETLNSTELSSWKSLLKAACVKYGVDEKSNGIVSSVAFDLAQGIEVEVH
jgi:hypothetical protein